jgi:hypothetical protein
LTLQSITSIASVSDLYILNDRGLVERCSSPLDWLDWMRTHVRLLDVKLMLNNREIVTLFAGYAGETRNGTPLTYATVVKPNPRTPEYALVVEWYATEAEALAGHRRALTHFEQDQKLRTA